MILEWILLAAFIYAVGLVTFKGWSQTKGRVYTFDQLIIWPWLLFKGEAK